MATMGTEKGRLAGILLVFLLALIQSVGADDQLPAENRNPIDQVREQIEYRIESPSLPGELVCGNEPICARGFIPGFYRNRAYAPVWSDTGGIKPTVDLLLGEIKQAERDGMRPADYHLAAIEMLVDAATTALPVDESGQARLLADTDILLTDAFLLFYVHVAKGRVNPETLHKDWLMASRDIDLRYAMAAAESETSLADLFQNEWPDHRGYAGLRAALAEMRRLAAAGGWPTVPEGPTLRPGEHDTRVVPLRRHLEVAGHLVTAQTPDVPRMFDKVLEAAVRRFQRQHGLKMDGVVGANTLRALNVTAEQRVRQIELNLERWRWLPHDLGRRYIVVNPAGFNLKLVEEGRTTLAMRVVVGRPARRTPVFSTPMNHLVLNPTWSVPYKLAVEDILPKIHRQGVNYLERQGIRVYSGGGQDVREINPWSVDWSAYGRKHFPFHFLQRPGRLNALGSIKFMMPNKFAVYLHDTPNRALFDLEKRDQSSGCIRVEKAFELAVAVLKNNEEWPPEKLKSRLQNGRTQTIYLREPLPVHLIYLTAWINDEGALQIREDIYGRDKSLDRALGKQDVSASQAALSTAFFPFETADSLQ